MTNKHSMEFGKKERLLNYSCQTYQLSRPNKVGAVMALIRECQPSTFEEWQEWYFKYATTCCRDPKNNTKITQQTLNELGERLYLKITQIVIPELRDVFSSLTLQDCTDFIHNLVINRTYDGYIREKSVIHDGLVKLFPSFTFEETPPELDHSGDVDYMVRVNGHAIGIQIKPITAAGNFAGYSLSERMSKSFEAFTKQFGGSVFIVYSNKGEIANPEIIEQLKLELNRLLTLSNKQPS